MLESTAFTIIKEWLKRQFYENWNGEKNERLIKERDQEKVTTDFNSSETDSFNQNTIRISCVDKVWKKTKRHCIFKKQLGLTTRSFKLAMTA